MSLSVEDIERIDEKLESAGFTIGEAYRQTGMCYGHLMPATLTAGMGLQIKHERISIIHEAKERVRRLVSHGWSRENAVRLAVGSYLDARGVPVLDDTFLYMTCFQCCYTESNKKLRG